MTSEEHGKLRPLGRDYLAGTSNVLLEQLGVTDAQEEVLINGIIALFGPPFYDEAPGERLVRALKCAVAIRAMTTRLPERPDFAVLREGGIAVSTGVNLAPLFVGQFGPNSNFTGFSSGMNNTARLQGCAVKNEILVMEESIAALPATAAFTFGDLRSAPVKNVAEPLKFRALL